jgi:hypothetical protein
MPSDSDRLCIATTFRSSRRFKLVHLRDAVYSTVCLVCGEPFFRIETTPAHKPQHLEERLKLDRTLAGAMEPKKHTQDSHVILPLALRLPALVLGLKPVRKRDIQIPAILLIRLVLQRTGHLLALLDGQHIVEIKHRLLPMRVLCVRARGELDGLVAGRELDVEPGDERVDEVVAAGGEAVGRGEGEVGRGDGVEVEGEDRGRVGDDGFHVDRVDEGLGHGGLFERRVVEAPDVVPDCRYLRKKGY